MPPPRDLLQEWHEAIARVDDIALLEFDWNHELKFPERIRWHDRLSGRDHEAARERARGDYFSIRASTVNGRALVWAPVSEATGPTARRLAPSFWSIVCKLRDTARSLK